MHSLRAQAGAGGEEIIIPDAETPPPLPDALMDEVPTTKLIWLYLRPLGKVAYSTRKLAAALNLLQRVATVGLKRLRVLGLLKDLGERRERVRPVYRAVEPEGRAVYRTDSKS